MCDRGDGRKIADIFQALHSRLALGSRTTRVKDAFSRLGSNAARVECAHGLLREFGLFPRLRPREKSGKAAGELRQEGNRLFKLKKDEAALIKYTESVANAPAGSEHLGLAYANRSAVLFEHKSYSECLEDISRAFENNYPNHLHEKLLRRRDKAVDESKSASFCFAPHEGLPPLSFEPSTTIECASDCVQIEYKEAFGRHVVATRDLKVGDVIAIEKPFTQILLRDSYLSHCYRCLRPCPNLIPCDSCPLVLFCGKSCKAASWNSTHKYECPIMATLLDLEINKLVLTALKICMVVGGANVLGEQRVPEGSVYKSDDYRAIHGLIANTEQRSWADLFERAVIAAVIFELVQAHTHYFAEEAAGSAFKELLLLHMQTAPLNFHEISELAKNEGGGYGEACEFGVGAYAFLSLLNHSCCPNVVRHCHGSSIVLRAVRRISKGEQLFDNYGYHYAVMPKCERLEHLRDQYYFHCNCEACTNSWPLYHDLPPIGFHFRMSQEMDLLRKADKTAARRAMPTLEGIANTLDKSTPCKEVAEAQEFLKQCYAILSNKCFSL